ncbi:hypothetical protein L3Q82_005922 [Scortum barcoo]|uniref:Uncharacterized protein n=1 Tax=Scortum barcoo TaxID=214431 RepID=A0ACB8X2Z5_9TELE|nr:hypothetical protein L3Q82_005922 [Scortum barcoo]
MSLLSPTPPDPSTVASGIVTVAQFMRRPLPRKTPEPDPTGCGFGGLRSREKAPAAGGRRSLILPSIQRGEQPSVSEAHFTAAEIQVDQNIRQHADPAASGSSHCDIFPIVSPHLPPEQGEVMGLRCLTWGKTVCIASNQIVERRTLPARKNGDDPASSHPDSHPSSNNNNERVDVILQTLLNLSSSVCVLLRELVDAFLAWYRDVSRGVFDFKKEALKYCRQDVDILTEGCIRFRDQFVKDTQVDPFSCITIASSACIKVFHTNFLTPKTLAVPPPDDYRRQFKSFSHPCIQWLELISHSSDIFIQHARNRELEVGAGLPGEAELGPGAEAAAGGAAEDTSEVSTVKISLQLRKKSSVQKAALLLCPTNTPKKQLVVIISSGIDNIPGKPPEFLIFHLGTKNETKPGLSVKNLAVLSGFGTKMQGEAQLDDGNTLEDGITANSAEVFSSEARSVTLSCTYSVKADNLQWYRQDPGSAPQFLLLITDTKEPSVVEAKPPHPRLTAKLNEERNQVYLQISSAAVTDSAVYYCALKPTVTGNSKTLPWPVEGTLNPDVVKTMKVLVSTYKADQKKGKKGEKRKEKRQMELGILQLFEEEGQRLTKAAKEEA